ncbi:sulfonate transport system substrate-binding protein [Bacillus mesophilus]|uniref:Putative aliphatic sulfonates-binding protein n=1 Tax=Bacillus mesophilus TaxID=1808955 RepID=A0A6M0QAS1_9BACI|nr:aliphatic sulfonate ABC transporter substrate-binding protein [Bacillus mesophilus]MBM7661457.1 sulfonate transport system substrate-binding protein [Bacillus mesophilus]NEY72128.1 aliphatic sulfonate ABC transporter substrate-binding protein [Bacillus mesophilus]
MKNKKYGILLTLILTISMGLLSACGSNTTSNNTEVSGNAEAAKPEKIRLDYAFYSPTSLVLKEKGWVEEAFEAEGIEVEWVQSLGSNKALEFLNSDSVDFGSTAGAAALIAKSKASPIETVYIYSKPEWTALVGPGDTTIKSVADLKGKKVAATLGTDPYIFLLRALDEAGLSSSDVEIVNLQHGDGASALVSGDVDAWAGLDPHMAKLEVTEGTSYIYRNPDFNTYGTLNVRSEFAEQYPQYVEKVIELYEKARTWAVENEEEAATILATQAQLDEEVAKLQISRNDFSSPVPGETQINALIEAGKVLQNGGVIDAGADLEKLANDLIQPSFAEKVIK